MGSIFHLARGVGTAGRAPRSVVHNPFHFRLQHVASESAFVALRVGGIGIVIEYVHGLNEVFDERRDFDLRPTASVCVSFVLCFPYSSRIDSFLTVIRCDLCVLCSSSGDFDVRRQSKFSAVCLLWWALHEHARKFSAIRRCWYLE